jgi:hypothetical protein
MYQRKRKSGNTRDNSGKRESKHQIRLKLVKRKGQRGREEGRKGNSNQGDSRNWE